MARRFSFFLSLGSVALILLPGLWQETGSLEKVKLGSAVKMVAQFYLPALTAEERGLWKENGLDVEWVPFATTPAMMRAMATGVVNISMAGGADTPLVAAERGLAMVIVLELVPNHPFVLWVRGDSPYRHVRDLKGTRISVTALGAPDHVMGRVIFAAYGMEKEVRFVGTGGTPQKVAGLRAGALEALIAKIVTVVDLKLAGHMREVASAGDYLPKPWIDDNIFARKDFLQSRPEIVRKILRATLQGIDFMRKNPRWTIEKMKSFQGLSEEGAKLLYDQLQFTTSGKIDRKAVENVRRILIEYGLVTEKVPGVDELFTNEYLL